MKLLLSTIMACAFCVTSGWAAENTMTGGGLNSGGPRSGESFNRGWRFCKGDSEGTDDKLGYAKLKPHLLPTAAEFMKDGAKAPEKAFDFSAPYAGADFDDSGWRALDLPHDWGIEGPFKQEYQGDTGKLPWWGVAWYRKQFELPPSDAGKQIYLDLDGAMAYAAVWVNGKLAGGWPYGYSSFRVNLTPFVKFGEKNIVAVRLDNPNDSSRWYPGGGIYRNTWLVKTDKIHVAHWGTKITTLTVSQAAAEVRLEATVENHTDGSADLTVKTEIYPLTPMGEKDGASVAEGSAPLKISAGERGTAELALRVGNPKLWDLEQPNMYRAMVTVSAGGKVLDVYHEDFGVRTIEFDANKGFLLNGRRVKLNGVCNHHDLGALGTAVNTRALERQIELLKEMGCNAIRTSHNMPAPELVALCNRMGVLLMVESFDCWEGGKKKNDYSRLWPDWREADTRAMVRRDRNNPSVIIWSVGNEVSEQWGSNWLVKALREYVRAEDVTRPVTVGCHWTDAGYNGFQKDVDVFGFNYKPWDYKKFHEKNPVIPIYGSETASTVSSRGEYFFPVTTDRGGGKADFQVSSYDLYAPPWAMPPDPEFRAQDASDYVLGEFVWTGFDYLGEPTPYNNDTTNLLNFTDGKEKERMKAEMEKLGKLPVPSRSSYFGILDLAGFKKDRFYIYQAKWRPNLPMAHIMPHWNWPERAGKETPVQVYTSGDEAELFLNGKSQGRLKKEADKDKYRLRWDKVVYEPGELKVVAYKNGKPWAEAAVKTSGEATQLQMTPDRKEIAADGRDLSFVTVQVSDADGQMVPRAKNPLKFDITGPGEIIAVDNGDATSHISFQGKEMPAFNGLCLVIVRSKENESGRITVRASADGLAAGKAEITTK